MGSWGKIEPAGQRTNYLLGQKSDGVKVEHEIKEINIYLFVELIC